MRQSGSVEEGAEGVSIPGLTTQDLEQIAEHGISVEDAQRQMDAYARPPAHTRLERACTIGDGITVVDADEIDGLLARYERACRENAVARFVPASGAASRMFRAPLSVRSGEADGLDALRASAAAGDADAEAVVEVVERIDDFAFRGDLADVLGEDPALLIAAGEIRRVLDGILSDDGLGYASLPKGLIRFHRYGEFARTAAEEQLVESALYGRASDNVCRLHFTVSPEHLDAFRAHIAEASADIEAKYGCKVAAGFSVQKASTDAVAVTPEGSLFRESDGSALFRPAGHGALLENLAEIDADAVFVKNIDNIVPDHLREPTVLWKRALGGLLFELRDGVAEHLSRLESDDCDDAAVDAALEFAAERLGVLPAADSSNRRQAALDLLSRPLRVCGMVRNEGEPGGGPFWVRKAGGLTKQIVEPNQVDPGDAAQQECFRTGTHFNPVDLVCSLRDHRGKRYALRDFIDHDTAFIAEKSKDGRPLKSFERPGLWNGAMAGWNSVFVEVPAETFNPVKTINDLLRPVHQPLGG